MLMIWNRALIGDDPQVEALCHRYIASLADKRQALQEARQAWRTSGDGDASLRALAALAHRLAGSAGSYGFDALGNQARLVDELADQVLESGSGKDCARLDAEISALLDALDQASLAH